MSYEGFTSQITNHNFYEVFDSASTKEIKTTSQTDCYVINGTRKCRHKKNLLIDSIVRNRMCIFLEPPAAAG